MTHPMNCETFAERLAEYLEQDMAGADRAAMDAHATACGECASLLSDLQSLTHAAADLPALAPSRDLWSGIAARIETRVVDIGAAAPRATAPRWPRLPMAAAAALVLVAAGVTFTARSGWEPIGGFRDGPTQLVSNKKDVSAEAVYDQEIALLRAVVEQRRLQLDSTTLAVIERNIDIIDQAIADSKAALSRDPASRYLLESLNHTLGSKLELLRVAAALPPRT